MVKSGSINNEKTVLSQIDYGGRSKETVRIWSKFLEGETTVSLDGFGDDTMTCVTSCPKPNIQRGRCIDKEYLYNDVLCLRIA